MARGGRTRKQARSNSEHDNVTAADLKRLKRSELLEIMLEQAKRIEELEAELSEARAALASREIVLNESGSIAEAALKLNDVFAAAQRAADQYLASVTQKVRGGGRSEKPNREHPGVAA